MPFLLYALLLYLQQGSHAFVWRRQRLHKKVLLVTDRHPSVLQHTCHPNITLHMNDKTLTAARISHIYGFLAGHTHLRLRSIVMDIKTQYRQRIAADKLFLSKSFTEIVLAAVTQLTAEISRRGWDRIVPECDFVIAGILTAIVGKYYSMWKVAPTQSDSTTPLHIQDPTDRSWDNFWRHQVPTNALQPFMMDGVTRPTWNLRLAALIAPMPSLFQAGFIASFIGYGLTSLMIRLRSKLIPSYVASTVPINIFHACLYTGAFLATMSNLRYQILQGWIEPRIIDKLLRLRYPVLHTFVIFWIRLANGLLGATLAIMGMKLLQLQRLRE